MTMDTELDKNLST